MAAHPSPPLIVTPTQRTILDRLLHQHTCPQNRTLRIQLILGLTATGYIAHVAQQQAVNQTTVRLWRDRWRDAAEGLAAAEVSDAAATALPGLIIRLLADAYRSGTPATFSSEQLTQLIALACESPPDAISHWTPQELALEAIRRGIVSAISARTVGRFLKRNPAQAASLPILAQSLHS